MALVEDHHRVTFPCILGLAKTRRKIVTPTKLVIILINKQAIIISCILALNPKPLTLDPANKFCQALPQDFFFIAPGNIDQTSGSKKAFLMFKAPMVVFYGILGDSKRCRVVLAALFKTE